MKSLRHKLVATAVVMVWNFLSRKKWLEAKDPEQN